jgi:hypothetical protein
MPLDTSVLHGVCQLLPGGVSFSCQPGAGELQGLQVPLEAVAAGKTTSRNCCRSCAPPVRSPDCRTHTVGSRARAFDRHRAVRYAIRASAMRASCGPSRRSMTWGTSHGDSSRSSVTKRFFGRQPRRSHVYAVFGKASSSAL